MIINDKFVFIHNPRTGGAFVKNTFKQTFPESDFLRLEDYHLPVSSLPEKHRAKMKFGMVRNPWAWYVSLYHFQQPHGQWLRLCSPDHRPTFQQFLSTFLSSDFAKKHRGEKFHPVGNPHAPKTVPVFDYMDNLDIGFFTYRYIYLFSYEYEKIFSGQADIFTNHDTLISVENVLKTEELPNNIINLFGRNGIPISEEDKKLWRTRPKRNYTNHKPYQSYYDNSLVELVRRKDRLIIEKYGYKF